MNTRAFLSHILIGALAVFAGVAQASSSRLDREASFEIPAQPLSTALVQFSKQAALQVVTASVELGERETGGVVGKRTVREALETLLSQSGLEYSLVGENTVAIAVADKLPQAQAGSNEEMRMAQSVGPAASDHVEKSEDTQLEEIVVTAQKRVERLQDVPVPVTAISGQSLVNSNQLRLQDYYNRVPGLTFEPGGRGEPSLAIRGIRGDYGANPSVGITVDDVPYGASTGTGGGYTAPDIDPNDLERVEVLRGPQGTLYGASSLGGLIKFVTVDPSTDAFSGRVQAGLNSIENGDDVGYNVRGSVNVPLGDTLALRASGFERHDAGYIDNPGLGLEGVNKSKAKGGRFAAMWRPSDRFSLKLNALLQDIQQQGSSFSTLQAGFDDLEQQAALGTGRLDRKSQVYSAQLNARLGIVDLTSISGYILNKIDSVLNSGGGLAIPFNLDGKKLTQEIRISAPIGERLNWMLGAFYTHEKSPSRQYIADVDPVTGALSLSQDVPFDIPYNTQYEEYAAFANLTWQVTDRLDVQFGGRQSEIRQVYDQITLFGGTVIRDSHGVANENAFTYLVTPRLKLSNDLMVYARFASGYRPGGNTANATLFNLPPTYDADETQNYEIGVKGNALEGKLSFDASLFYIDWKDMQVIAGNSSGFSWVENAGGADSKGVELTVESRPLKGMRISGWLVYNEAALSQDFPTPANTFSVVGLSGDRLPFISRVSGNLSLDQDFPLGNEVTGFVGGSVSYVGDRNDNFAVLANPTRFDLPSYTQVDLLGGVRYGSWTASLFANNVLDKRGTLSVDPRVANSIYYIQPRTLGLSLAKTF